MSLGAVFTAVQYADILFSIKDLKKFYSTAAIVGYTNIHLDWSVPVLIAFPVFYK